jgi:beta-lactamase regulating signal transducer with metallopeptidase domain
MDVLLAIALKSLVIAGATLALLALMKRRSASERSSVAHVGLIALVLLAFAPLALPNWTVEAPALLGHAPTVQAPLKIDAVHAPMASAPVPAATTATAPAPLTLPPAAIATALYAVPAVVLLIITLLALARLVALRARADVLVDGHWLSALARAQRRMGFKHGTALLTSDELASPISWGLVRPVILLNDRAVAASAEAEAIIAHELAHVARLDWAKLLLARIATALFWFNPLVWVLAREAHQLREETADDAVLAANIADTDYAQLLVGVARHECSGLLLGAHGVAPSKSSLARRVARVLDAGSARAPAARPFALGVLTGALVVATPLAALTLTPGGTKAAKQSAKSGAPTAALPLYYSPEPVADDLPHIIADGVSTAVAAVAPAEPVNSAAIASVEAANRRVIAQARREAAIDARQGARERQIAGRERHHDDIERLVELKAAGVTPEYAAAIRAAAPRLSNAGFDDIAGLKNMGVTPEYVRSMVAAGLRDITADELNEARAVGVSGDYVAALARAGLRGSVDDYVQLRAVGVSPAFVERLRRAGYRTSDPDKIVELQVLDGASFHSRPPPPPKPPKVPPPGWNPDDDEDPDGG